MPVDNDQITEAVRERYASIASAVTERGAESSCCGPAEATEQPESSCCGPTPVTIAERHTQAGEVFGPSLYTGTDVDAIPENATEASLGCGNPTAIAELHDGETVLDLGSGAGLDVLLSARRVAPTGRAYGLDMTDEMLELARANQAESGIENAEFLKGHIEDIPLPDASVDVIVSNCVINLSADKAAVFREARRVLRPGGRFAVSDVLATRPLTEQERSDMASWTGCIAGALTQDEYVGGLEGAGFRDIEVVVTHDVAPMAVSAIVRATA